MLTLMLPLEPAVQQRTAGRDISRSLITLATPFRNRCFQEHMFSGTHVFRNRFRERLILGTDCRKTHKKHACGPNPEEQDRSPSVFISLCTLNPKP